MKTEEIRKRAEAIRNGTSIPTRSAWYPEPIASAGITELAKLVEYLAEKTMALEAELSELRDTLNSDSHA